MIYSIDIEYNHTSLPTNTVVIKTI